MIRTYIIGPTVGRSYLGKGEFDVAVSMLGHSQREVIIPHDLFTDDEQRSMTVAASVVRRKEVLATCNEVFYLPNWNTDTVAVAEMDHARTLGILIRPFYGPINQINAK